MPLPTDAKERKATPIYSGVIKYFPLALAEVSRVSRAGNIQHNGPDAPLFWDKTKSMDHHECIVRHLIDAGTMDSDGQRHSAKVAWRALAALEMELEDTTGEGRKDALGQGHLTDCPVCGSGRDNYCCNHCEHA